MKFCYTVTAVPEHHGMTASPFQVLHWKVVEKVCWRWRKNQQTGEHSSQPSSGSSRLDRASRTLSSSNYTKAY